MDDLDRAAVEADRFLEQSIYQHHQEHSKEQPVFNKNGIRICLDCLTLIPIARVRSIDAVRCVGCQEVEEWRLKLWG